MGEHQRMAERNQLGSALGGGDAGDARDLERVPLGIAGQLLERGRRDGTKAWARAVRRVSGLAETSTMRGLPAES